MVVELWSVTKLSLLLPPMFPQADIVLWFFVEEIHAGGEVAVILPENFCECDEGHILHRAVWIVEALD